MQVLADHVLALTRKWSHRGKEVSSTQSRIRNQNSNVSCFHTFGDTCHESNSIVTIISSWKLPVMWICVKQICLCAMLLYLILKHTGSITEVFQTTQLYTNEGRGKSDKTLKKDKFCMFSNSQSVPQRINCSATSFKSLGTSTRQQNFTNHHYNFQCWADARLGLVTNFPPMRRSSTSSRPTTWRVSWTPSRWTFSSPSLTLRPAPCPPSTCPAAVDQPIGRNGKGEEKGQHWI